MRIAAASIATASDHQLQIREQQSLRVEFRRDQNATQNIQARPPSAPARSDTTSGETTQLPELDAESQRILDILERVFGARIRTSPVVPKPHAVTLEPPSATGPAVEAPRFGWSLAIDHSYQYEEHERTSFAVAGSVTTDDGRSLDLTYQLELSRDYVTTTTFSLRAGDPIDPLVLDLDGGGVAFTSARYQFDLNADGQTEGLRAFADSSAFLAHDRNGDGRIADGSELFGPRSGSGFAELAALDDDGNGFIDAGDSAFHELGLFTGSSFTSLADSGIGALMTSATSTPFTITDDANQALAQVTRSAIYLRESGQAGGLHELDLMA